MKCLALYGGLKEFPAEPHPWGPILPFWKIESARQRAPSSARAISSRSRGGAGMSPKRSFFAAPSSVFLVCTMLLTDKAMFAAVS
jgi:hypothetical protein